MTRVILMAPTVSAQLLKKILPKLDRIYIVYVKSYSPGFTAFWHWLKGQS